MNTDDARALMVRLLHRIAPEVDASGLDDTALIQEQLDLDSMDFLNLVTGLHDQAGIDVPERDYPQLATVGGFIAYVAAAGTPGGRSP